MLKTRTLPKRGEKSWYDLYEEIGDDAITDNITWEQQAIFPTLDVINCFLMGQILKGKDLHSGKSMLQLFVDLISAQVKVILDNGLMTDEFYAKNKNLLDEKNGIKQNQNIDMHTLYRIAFDIEKLINNYLYNLGNERDNWDREGDFWYDNEAFFRISK